MIDLSSLIDQHSASFVERLDGLPEPQLFLKNIQARLQFMSNPRWNVAVSMGVLLRAIGTLESAVLGALAGEVTVVDRLVAENRLRTVLNDILHEHADRFDREYERLKDQEHPLQEALDRHRALADGLLRTRHAGVAVLDASGRILAWSLGAARVTHRSAPSVMGQPIGQIIPAVQELMEAHINESLSLSSGIETPIEGSCSLQLVGDQAPVELSFRLGLLRTYSGPQHEAAILSLWDITELRSLRARVLEGDRLQAMSRIAGSVAHEIRNPLNALFLNTDLLEVELGSTGEENPQVQRLLGVIRQEVEKLNGIVTDYLSLARLADRHRDRVDAVAFLRAVLDEIRHWEEERQIELAVRLPVEPVMAPIDAKQLRRALMNLLVNARDAMPGGGVLTLSLEPLDHELELLIEDTGVGMTAEDLDRVTTPFFTRKEGGTGLGSYLAREIIVAHRGKLEFQSSRGEGTRVWVRLPRTP